MRCFCNHNATGDSRPCGRRAEGGRPRDPHRPGGEETVSGTNGILSPKLGASLRMTMATSLYANVSRGFRSTDGIIEDPSLPLITTWAGETGVKLDAARLRGTASLFRMNVSNEQTLNPITLETTSGGGSIRQGLDLEAAWTPTPAATVSANWTFTDAHYQHLVSGGGEESLELPPSGASASLQRTPPVNLHVEEETGPVVLDGVRVFNTARYVGVAAVDVGPLEPPGGCASAGTGWVHTRHSTSPGCCWAATGWRTPPSSSPRGAPPGTWACETHSTGAIRRSSRAKRSLPGNRGPPSSRGVFFGSAPGGVARVDHGQSPAPRMPRFRMRCSSSG